MKILPVPIIPNQMNIIFEWIRLNSLNTPYKNSKIFLIQLKIPIFCFRNHRNVRKKDSKNFELIKKGFLP